MESPLGGEGEGGGAAYLDTHLMRADPPQMRASSMGINYEAMTAKAAEMLAESESKAGAGVKMPVGDTTMEDVKPVKSAPAGDTWLALPDTTRVRSLRTFL